VTVRQSTQLASLVRGVSWFTAAMLGVWAVGRLARQSSTIAQLLAEKEQIAQVERERLDAEVRHRTAQLTEFAQHLQSAREDERSHLARELHDELGALLTAAKLDTARLKAKLGEMSPEIADRLAHLNGLLNDGIALKRQITENLRPSSLGNLGLVDSLEILSRDFASTSGLVVHCAVEPVDLGPSGELTAYRLVQEALNNIAKHARATDVWVVMTQTGSTVTVSVRDNGHGFMPQSVRRAAHGLLGMRYRVEAEGGVMLLASAPGLGTRIEGRLPAVLSPLPASPSAATPPLPITPG